MKFEIEKVAQDRFKIEIDGDMLRLLLSIAPPADPEPLATRLVIVSPEGEEVENPFHLDQEFERPLGEFRQAADVDVESHIIKPTRAKLNKPRTSVKITDTVDVKPIKRMVTLEEKGELKPDAVAGSNPEDPEPLSTMGKILAVIRKGPPRTAGQLIEFSKMTPAQVYNCTSQMKTAGLIKIVATDEGNAWVPA